MVDINHLLRPGHLRQLAAILDDPEATGNDKFVAYDLLKNANIAAGGVLPMCQDTGTAIVMGKKGRAIVTDGTDEGAIARGHPRRVPEEEPALLAGRAAVDVRGGQHALEPAGADRDLCRGRGRLQVPVRGEGRRLGEQDLPLPGDAGGADEGAADAVPQGEDPDARHRRLPALSSRHRHRRPHRRADAEDREARLDPLPRRAADRRLGGRARLPRPRHGGRGAQDDAGARRRRPVRRQVFLPRRARHPAAAPRRLAADRARRLVLGRPPGAREDHPRRRLPRGARGEPGPLPARDRRGRARRRRSCASTSTGRCPTSSAR